MFTIITTTSICPIIFFPCKSFFNYQILTISQPGFARTRPSLSPTDQATPLAVAKSIHVSKPQEETLKKTRFETHHISNPKFLENRNLNTLFLTSSCCKNIGRGHSNLMAVKMGYSGTVTRVVLHVFSFFGVAYFVYLSPNGVAQYCTALYKTNKWL